MRNTNSFNFIVYLNSRHYHYYQHTIISMRVNCFLAFYLPFALTFASNLFSIINKACDKECAVAQAILYWREFNSHLMMFCVCTTCLTNEKDFTENFSFQQIFIRICARASLKNWENERKFHFHFWEENKFNDIEGKTWRNFLE
jgi:hypothetical protein